MSFAEIVERILAEKIDAHNAALVSADHTISYVENYDVGTLQNGQVRIRPLVTGVCGTDVKILNNQKPCANGPIGHEATAVVIESLSKQLKRGDFVVISPHIAEQRATGFYHGNIGYSEGKGVLIREQILDQQRLKLIPKEFEDMYAAEALTQADGLACCVRSQKVLQIKEGMRAVVLGSGTMGILHGQLLQSQQVHVSFVDINQNALDMAKKVGIGDAYYVTSSVGSLQDSFDIVIVANGDPASYAQAIQLVKDGGQYNAFAGMFNQQRTIKIGDQEIDVMAYHLEEKKPESIQCKEKMIRFSGALGYHAEEFNFACELLLQKKVDPTPLITKRIPLNAQTQSQILELYGLGGKIMTYPYFDLIFA